MKLNFQENKKEEDYYLESFINDQINSISQCSVDTLTIESPDGDNPNKSASDYYIPELDILIEIKKLFDKEEYEEHIAWSKNLDRIKVSLNSFDKSGLVGAYLIDLDFSFRIKRGTEDNFIEQLLDAIRNGYTEHVIHNNEIKIKKFSDEGNEIYFGGTGSVQWANPEGTITENIHDKLKIANNQLGIQEANNKIVLIVNRYLFGNEYRHFINYLAGNVESLLKWTNINEIWLQYGNNASHEIKHIRLYNQEFLTGILKVDSNILSKFLDLFNLWFYPLMEFDQSHNTQLLELLKSLFSNKIPHEVILENYVRENIVRLGEWLGKSKNYDDLEWLLKTFITDPDPIDEPEHFDVIRSVRGFLAWELRYLPFNENHIHEALELVDKLSKDPIIYIRYMGLFALVEIAGRRGWLDNTNQRPRQGKYQTFHDIVFRYIAMINKSDYGLELAKNTLNIFWFYKDLDTAETLEALKALEINAESAKLAVYFAILRSKHFEDFNIEYRAEEVQKYLLAQISDPYVSNRYKMYVVIGITEVLKYDENEFENIRKFVQTLLEQRYDQEFYSPIESLILKIMPVHQSQCVDWYVKYIRNIVSYADSMKGDDTYNGIWLWRHTKIMNQIKEYDEDKYLKINEILNSSSALEIFLH